MKSTICLLSLFFLSGCASGKKRALPPPSAIIKPPTAKTITLGNDVAVMEKALNQAGDRAERIRILLNSLDNNPGTN